MSSEATTIDPEKSRSSETVRPRPRPCIHPISGLKVPAKTRATRTTSPTTQSWPASHTPAATASSSPMVRGAISKRTTGAGGREVMVSLRRSTCAETGSKGAAALDDADQHHHDGDHEQDVDEAAERVRADESENPEHQEHDGNGPEHGGLKPWERASGAAPPRRFRRWLSRSPSSLRRSASTARGGGGPGRAWTAPCGAASRPRHGRQ